MNSAEKQKLNPTLKLVLDIGPLVLFFAANAKFGIFAATGAFMVAVLAALAFAYVKTRRIEIMPVVTAVIVFIFGGLTLILHNDTFIKLKPTIIYLLFGGALVVGLMMGKPLLGMLFEFGVRSHRGRLAQIDLALGDILLLSRRRERDRLAQFLHRHLGELQAVRRGTAHLPVRRAAISAADEIQHQYRREELTRRANEARDQAVTCAVA